MNVSSRPLPRLGVVVISAIADDPRVRRQGDLFTAAGWSVKGFGLPGGRSAAPNWRIFDLPPPGDAIDLDPARRGSLRPEIESEREGIGLLRRKIDTALTLVKDDGFFSALRFAFGRMAPSIVKRSIRHLQQGVYAVSLPFGVGDWEAEYWRLNSVFDDVYRAARAHHCDVWLANDWSALPIARAIAREQQAVLLYDTHELASDEFPERWRWRLLHRPVVMAIEGACIRDAKRVSCVSDGIADRLQINYRLSERPNVVRNTPRYEPISFRATGEIVEVLYHGLVSPQRGLEACIRSVAKWRPEFKLTIRGPATSEYRQGLESLIAQLDVANRVRLVPPVPMIDLVREASRFDVGLFALPGHSRHNQFALPNKLFEYIMAGLAVCVSDLPEMARIVRDYDLGALIRAVDPDAIAAAVNGLDRAGIDRCKMRALEAARHLNWEVEGARFVAAAETALVEANRIGSPAYH
jgi:glycosyltransferase involved in cell wall biosynthesis